MSAYRGVAIATGGAALALFALTVCPTVPFGDGGDLIVASTELGVAHPPGYPLYTLIGRLALAVPLGEPALRVNLLSALFGAVACALAAGFVHRRTGSPRAAVGAGLGLAATSTFWSVSTVAEVYSLHALLVVGLLEASARVGEAEDGRSRGRALVAAAILFGLGLAHHPTIVLAAPSALILASRFRRTAPSALPAASAAHRLLALVALVGLPVLFYGSLLIRARLADGAAWGGPVTLSGLAAHATAAAYRFHDLGWVGLARVEGWADLGGLALEEGAYVALPLALLGLAASGRLRLRAALLALVLVCSLFYLRYAAEDAQVYFLQASLGLSLLAGLGIAALESRARGLAPLVGGTAAAALFVAPLAMHYPSRDLRGVIAPAHYGRDVLAAIPEGGVLFVEGDDAFLLVYLTRVLGERPDLTLYDRNGTVLPDLLREEPGPPRRPEESPLVYRIRREIAFLEAEAARPAPRPVFFLSWPGYELPPGLRFEPIGLVYEVRRSGEPPRQDAAIRASLHEREVVEEARRIGGSFAHAVAGTYPLMRGERHLFLGEVERAFEAFDEASRVAGDSETIHNTLGTIFGRRGDYGRAIRELEAAVRVKPVSIRAWNNLAYARLLAGDREGARHAYARSLGLDSRQGEVEHALRRLGGAR